MTDETRDQRQKRRANILSQEDQRRAFETALQRAPISGSVSVSNFPADPAKGAKQDTTNTQIGAVAETAPGTDTASSGLNGRLQRVAQRLTSLIGLLPASLGAKTSANSLSVVTASDSYPLPYESAVALDLVNGAFAETRNGRNSDVDTAGEEDLWNVGGAWVPITAAQTITIASTSGNDTAAGTGARTALLRGLDGSYNRISETITLNGVTPVVSVNTYTFVSDLEIMTVGSGGTNAGQITGTATTDTTIQFRMAATDGRTQLSWYMVPAGYSALCHGYFMSMNNTAAGAVIRAEFKIKQFGRTFVTRGYASTRNDGNGQAFVPFIPPLKLPEKTIVKVSATSDTNNSDVQVTYGLSMRAN